MNDSETIECYSVNDLELIVTHVLDRYCNTFSTDGRIPTLWVILSDRNQFCLSLNATLGSAATFTTNYSVSDIWPDKVICLTWVH